MDARLDSELLRTFVAIADTGSFTHAAEIVRRTQSAVSMQVKRLEEAAGQSLFLREARGVRLTPPGETLLATARRVVRLLDQAADTLRIEPLEGTVKMGIPEEYGATILPDVLARFADRHPGIQVTVKCESSLALDSAIDEGELDLAVLVVDRGNAKGETLFHDPTVWVTSAKHLVHEHDPLPVALFEQGCWWRDWALKDLDDRGRRYHVAYTSSSVAGLQAAVMSGLAVAVLGQSTVPQGARALSEADEFSNLPGSRIVLRRRQGASSQAAASMDSAIRDAFRTGTVASPSVSR